MTTALLPVERDGGKSLKPQALEGFVKYQNAVMAQRKVWPDAGVDVLTRARWDDAARADAGLAVEEIERIERLVSAVAARREVAKAQAPGLLRPAVTVDGGPLADPLAAERLEFGEADVNLLVSREAELLKLWEQLASGSTF